MKKLVSVDFHAQFGCLKKPDINDGIYLTYNLIHKPALQGIFGAIIGLSGYSIEGKMDEKDIPEFRKKLDEIKISLQPIGTHENGNFKKDVILFNNTVGYASEEEGNILNVREQTLIKPSYRVFVFLDNKNENHNSLFESLKNQEAVYVPYLGKNDHQLWWNNFHEWEILDADFKPNQNFKIDSVFLKPNQDERLIPEQRSVSLGDTNEKFAYYERLPKGWHSELPHYELGEFLFTNFNLEQGSEIANLMKIENDKGEKLTIQLF